MNKKSISLLVVIVLIVATIYYLESTKSKIAVNSEQNTDVASEENSKYVRAPELTGIDGYLNTNEELKIADLKGKVILIDFWTYTCINCIRTLPFLAEWDKKYRNKGLIIIGVHTPEFEFEKDCENVKKAIEKYNIKYAVVQDNDYATWNAYGNRFWPHKYLIDSKGFIRYDHIGEGSYEETEKEIQKLLMEIGSNVSDVKTSKLEDRTPALLQTPELYAGYEYALSRNQDIGNKEGLKPEEVIDYSLPDGIKENKIYLEGKWKSNKDNLQVQDEKESKLFLTFTASSVNLVAGSLAGPIELDVFVNDEYVKKEQAGLDINFDNERSFVLIDGPRLYNLMNGPYGTYKLKLVGSSKNFYFDSFTFG